MLVGGFESGASYADGAFVDRDVGGIDDGGFKNPVTRADEKRATLLNDRLAALAYAGTAALPGNSATSAH